MNCSGCRMVAVIDGSSHCAAPLCPREKGAKAMKSAVASPTIVEAVPTGEFRYCTPSREFVPARLQRKYKCKSSDGLVGEVWISGVVRSDSGIFVPDAPYPFDLITEKINERHH